MSTAIGATDSNRPSLPGLPAGMRWRVEKGVYGYLLLSMEEEGTTFWGNKKWKAIKTEHVDMYERLEPHQIKEKVEQLAKQMLDVYTKEHARDLAKRAVVGIYEQGGDSL